MGYVKKKSVKNNSSWGFEKTKIKENTFTKPSALLLFFGLLMLGISIFQFVSKWQETGDIFASFNLDFINFFLFGLAFLFLGNIKALENAVGEASFSAAGILIQFPLYAGIMGIMKYSGLGAFISQGFVEISTATTLPIYTLLSAGLVNIFVPSGGGQWVVQGPIITEAAETLGVSIPKTVMALAYGDQLTNMLQPFWALPLLGITKLKAKDILPYSGLVMLVGLTIFITVLLIF